MSTSNCYNYFLTSLSVVQFHISCLVVILNGLFILSNEDLVLVALGRLKTVLPC